MIKYMKMKIILLLGILINSQQIFAQSSIPESVSKNDASFWNAGAIIALIAAVIAIGLSVWLFLETSRLKVEISQLRKTNKSEISKTGGTLEKLNKELDGLKKYVLSRKSDLTQEKSSPLSSNPDVTSHNQRTVLKEDTSAIKTEGDAKGAPSNGNPNTPPASSLRTIFFGSPRSNVFSNGKGTFVPGQSLYKLQEVSPGKAEFVFSDRREALQVALRSLSEYIESGCIIVHETGMNPTKVITVKPGTATLNGSTWTIVTKAQIELS